MSTSIVIAQYVEDVSWINKLRTDIKVYLYRKNYKSFYKDSFDAIYLPNIGREAHTFLHHIINNYDSLSEINIFVQGTPRIDVDIINNHLSINSVPHINLTKSNSVYLDPSDKITRWRGQELVISAYNFFEWYNLFIDPKKIVPPYNIYFESNFIVSKHNILSRSKTYYEKLLNQLNANNTEVAHFLERSWYYIFYGQSILGV